MENDFFKIAEECHKDRLKNEYYDQFNIDKIAKLEYSLFCAWCNAFKNAQYTEQNFKQYLKTEKELSFWIKKKIVELYFGYEYSFDNNTKIWNCKKIKAV